MKIKKLVISFLLFIHICTICYGDGLLDGKPTIKISGKTVEISFKVKKYTDVAVEVIDSKGNVIRHLGAGLLGPNAPLPFKKNSKTQTISWDLKDNDEKKIDPKGKFRVLVKAGLKPAFGRIIGQSGQTLQIIRGLEVDDKGNLIVISKGMPLTHRPQLEIKVFNREGVYQRMILPVAANLPASKLNCVIYADLPNGKKIPFMRNPYERTRLPALNLVSHQPTLTSDGKLIFPSSDHDYNSRLVSVGLDGSLGKDILGHYIAKREKPYDHGIRHRVWPRLFLAASPDNKYIYASGIVRSYRAVSVWGFNGKPVAFDNCVYRVDRKSGEVKVFAGKKWAKDSPLSNPLGVQVDEDGNVYICDYGNDRIAVFNKDGKHLHDLKVQKPVKLGIHTSGKVYVFSVSGLVKDANPNREKLANRIVRLAGKKNDTQEAEIKLNNLNGKVEMAFALDRTSQPAVIWAGPFSGVLTHRAHVGNIHKIVDEGKSFKDLGDVITSKNKNPEFGKYHKHMVVDPDTEEVWWDHHKFNGKTGEYIGRFKPYGYSRGFDAEPRFGPNNSVVFWEDSVMRFKRDGSPFPFSSLKSHKIPRDDKNIGYTWGDYPRAFKVDRKGNLYIMGTNTKGSGKLVRINENGTYRDAGHIMIEATTSGLGMDSRGNFYFMSQLRKPGSPKLPDHWEKVFKTNKSENTSYLYEKSTGSLMKFPPEGVKILWDPDGKDYVGLQKWKEKERTGKTDREPIWSKFGISGIYSRFSKPSCVCEVPSLEVDGHNRIYVPDPLAYSILIFDENGNQISRFGEYGNLDSQGPGSKIPVPELPITYAFRIAVSNTAVYVNDCQSRRILKVNLDYKDNISINMNGKIVK
jgi:hypothetical protein